MKENGIEIFDWHQAQVIAALRMKGTTLSALSRSKGLNSRTLNNVFYRHYPHGQDIIAEALNMKPSEIWPTRYKKVD